MLFTGYIYKITGACGLIYIGSTTNMKNRKYPHNSTANVCSSKLLKKPLQFVIIDTRKYKLMKTLYLVEQFYLDNNNTINQVRAYTNYKSLGYLLRKKIKDRNYYNKNKEKLLEKSKIYYNKNREKKNEKGNIYYNKNKEKISKQRKEKVKCECGCLINKYHMPRHKRSPKHINLLNQKSIN